MFWVRAGSKAATCQCTTPNVNGLANLPAAEVVFQREETGEGMRVLDNTAAIAAGIATNNATFPNEQTRFPIPTGTGGSTGVAGAGGGNQGSGGAGGAGSGTGGMGPGTGGTASNPGGAAGPAASTRPTGRRRQQRRRLRLCDRRLRGRLRARSSSRSPDCSADRSRGGAAAGPRLTARCRRSRPSVRLRPWWKHGWSARTSLVGEAQSVGRPWPRRPVGVRRDRAARRRHPVPLQRAQPTVRLGGVLAVLTALPLLAQHPLGRQVRLMGRRRERPELRTVSPHQAGGTSNLGDDDRLFAPFQMAPDGWIATRRRAARPDRSRSWRARWPRSHRPGNRMVSV